MAADADVGAASRHALASTSANIHDHRPVPVQLL